MKAQSEVEVTFALNGKKRTVRAHPMKRLLDVLREDCATTGPKEGCGEGECGACLVLANDVPVLTCLTPLCQVDGWEIVTIEGLAKEGLHPMQEAFWEEGGAQCGICTPGMILAAVHYLDHPDAADDLGEALAGNQCRCTGYIKIFASVRKAFAKVGRPLPEGAREGAETT